MRNKRAQLLFPLLSGVLFSDYEHAKLEQLKEEVRASSYGAQEYHRPVEFAEMVTRDIEKYIEAQVRVFHLQKQNNNNNNKKKTQKNNNNKNKTKTIT